MKNDELKITALRQRIGEITSVYEDRIADLRVELTVLSEDLSTSKQEVERLNGLVQEKDALLADTTPDED